MNSRLPDAQQLAVLWADVEKLGKSTRTPFRREQNRPAGV
jgi:hypothetical protein